MELSGVHSLTTGDSASTLSSSEPPGDVKPGHIIFAPESTNLIAPLSTLNIFIIDGSTKHDQS